MGPTEWLLEGPPWVQYRARLDLLDQREDDPQVNSARREMVVDKSVKTLLAELAKWPGRPLKRHNDADHPLHKLAFVADLGLRAGDPGVDRIVDRLLESQSKEGAFQILVNIPVRFGGTGNDQSAWMLCDAPTVLYALLKFGLQSDRRVETAVDYLTGLVRDNGWPCAATEDLGKFRGPGRKGDPCPYATLIMLKALSEMPEWRDSEACRAGVESLLDLWRERKERRPYLFAMGTRFAKLKAPLIWYDILHVTDVLARFPWAREDDRFKEMVGVVATKADEQGRFTSESVWRAWREWEFGQKRDPSRWVTLLARRMLRVANV